MSQNGRRSQRTPILWGLATISYWADDMPAACAWYSDLLGIEPYFQRPDADNLAYVEFRLGDCQHELGIIDASYAPQGAPAGPGGVVAYWHVDDVPATLEQFIAMGAREHQPIISWAPAGFVTASIVDPFGTILGVVHNPHYLEILRLAQTS